MFGWFKKDADPDAELRASLVSSLEKYNPDDVGDDDTTTTDIEVDGGTVRVPKIKATAIEELTLTEFESDPTVNNLATDVTDPWSRVRK